MVYLEKEVMHQNEEVDEFYYSDEYLYNQTNLDLLLGTQAWRKNLLDDMDSLNSMINTLGDESKQQLRFEYLQGKKKEYINYWGGGCPNCRGRNGGGDIMFDEMEMMPMAAMAFDDGGAGGAPPPIMEKAAFAPAAAMDVMP